MLALALLRMPGRPSTPRTVLPLATADSPAACDWTSPALVLREELVVAVAVVASAAAVEVLEEAVVVEAAVAAVVSAAVVAASVVTVAATSALSTAPSPATQAPRSPSTKKVSSKFGLIYIEGCGYLRFPLQSTFGFLGLGFSGLWRRSLAIERRSTLGALTHCNLWARRSASHGSMVKMA